MNALVEIAAAHAPVSGATSAALTRVADLIQRELASPISEVDALCRHVERYRGKMLRPTLAIVSALAARPDRADEPVPGAVVTVAAVLEMVHLATLVHDDVLDEAGVRRGQRTINALRGNETAVILGDYLISKSFHLCSALDDQSIALRVGEVTSIVCEGEMLQLSHRGDMAISEAAYFDIIDRKTAALIGVACELGARCAGAPLDDCQRLHTFGRRVGVAFQIIDDLLDLIGEERIVGKSLGKDLEKGKLTLPMLHHRARAGALRESDLAHERRQTLIRRLESTGSIEHARSKAADLISDAKVVLEGLPDSPARSYLAALAEAVLTRQY